jgi:UV radiation resistance-associated gene protein
VPSLSSSLQKVSPALSASSVRSGSDSPPSTPLHPIPNYLSPIHRPSTNPSFSIDAHSRHEFAEWTDMSAEKLKVEVWGKVESGWQSHGHLSGKGKEKERDHSNPEEGGADWKVLEEWNIDLGDLVCLPEDASFPYAHSRYD